MSESEEDSDFPLDQEEAPSDDDALSLPSDSDEDQSDDQPASDSDNPRLPQIKPKLKLRGLKAFDKRIITEPEKCGVIYLSRIPPGMNVSMIREYFAHYGDIGRVYLEPEKPFGGKRKRKEKHRKRVVFKEGWVEFLRKKKAKQVAENLNNQMVGGKRHSPWYDFLWNIKYLHRFKWANLSERLAYETAARHQRLRAEVDQAKRQTNFYKDAVEKKNMLDRIEKTKKGDFEALKTRKVVQKEPITEDETGRVGKKSFAEKMESKREKNRRKRQKKAEKSKNSDETPGQIDPEILDGLFV